MNETLAVVNIVLAAGISGVSFILFLKTHRFFRWVRLMYTFDGLILLGIQISSLLSGQPNDLIYKGGVTLVLTTILSSALLTFLGGGNYDPSDCTGK